MKRSVILKDEKHDHYWTSNNCLYESYRTIRGLRYRFITEVDYPDCDDLKDVDIQAIKSILES